MHITFHGQSCFEILIKQEKDSDTKLVIDPYDEKTGLRIPKLEADIILISHDHFDHNNVKGVLPAKKEESPFVIDGPGEYEKKGVFINGIPGFHDNSNGKERGRITMYTIDAEEMRLLHLGDLGQKELTDEQMERIGDVDILMIPVGGTFTISSKEAVSIMSQIEPKIIIPMHYKIPKLTLEIDDLQKFLKEMGLKSLEPLPKIVIKKKDLPDDEAKIIVLNP